MKESETISSPKNPLVKELRKLHQAKGRRQQQRFLLEGTHLLEEAVRSPYPLDFVLATPAWQQRHGDLWARARQHAQTCLTAAEGVIASIATTVAPDGVVAIAPHRVCEPQAIARAGLLLENLQDPGNLGTIARTAAAAGADGIWLNRTSVDPENPKVLRASAGQWFRLPIALCDDAAAEVERHRQGGARAIATDPEAPQAYWDVDLAMPILLLLGNEGAGLSEELLARADARVRIPQEANVESLNVAIAAALLLYEARRQRDRACRGVSRNAPTPESRNAPAPESFNS